VPCTGMCEVAVCDRPVDSHARHNHPWPYLLLGRQVPCHHGVIPLGPAAPALSAVVPLPLPLPLTIAVPPPVATPPAPAQTTTPPTGTTTT
jgi:hypothetical protein